jgi:hypothetical protein
VTAPEKATPRWHGADSEEQTKTNAAILPESAEQWRVEVEQRDKKFAGLRASAALNHGIELYVIGDARGTAYLAAKWGWTKTFTDLEAVETWLARVGGGK